MGSVQVATNALGHFFIVKKAHSQAFASPLLAEATLLQLVEHPRIPRVYGLFRHEETLCLVEDYLGEETLRDFCRRLGAPLLDAEVKSLMRGLFETVQSLHAQGVVHLDIKPENLMLDREGKLYLVDFGSARFNEERCTESGTGVYMAPESHHLSGVRKRDEWSLGVLLYRLLTGEFPCNSFDLLEGRTDLAASLSCVGSPLRVRTTDAGMNLVSKLLEIDPTRRISVKEALEHPWFQEASSPSSQAETPTPQRVHDPLDIDSDDEG
jgi:serine/threonine protein kinase